GCRDQPPGVSLLELFRSSGSRVVRWGCRVAARAGAIGLCVEPLLCAEQPQLRRVLLDLEAEAQRSRLDQEGALAVGVAAEVMSLDAKVASPGVEVAHPRQRGA